MMAPEIEALARTALAAGYGMDLRFGDNGRGNHQSISASITVADGVRLFGYGANKQEALEDLSSKMETFRSALNSLLEETRPA